MTDIWKKEHESRILVDPKNVQKRNLLRMVPPRVAQISKQASKAEFFFF